jgi:hypothetical protein
MGAGQGFLPQGDTSGDCECADCNRSPGAVWSLGENVERVRLLSHGERCPHAVFIVACQACWHVAVGGC